MSIVGLFVFENREFLLIRVALVAAGLLRFWQANRLGIDSLFGTNLFVLFLNAQYCLLSKLTVTITWSNTLTALVSSTATWSSSTSSSSIADVLIT